MEAQFNGQQYNRELYKKYDEAADYMTANFDKKINKVLLSSFSNNQKIDFLSRIEEKINSSATILKEQNTNTLELKLKSINNVIRIKQKNFDDLKPVYYGTKRGYKDPVTERNKLKKEMKSLTKRKTLIENQISGKVLPEEIANSALSKVTDYILRLQLGKEINLLPIKPKPKQMPSTSQQPQYYQMPVNTIFNDPRIIQQQELPALNEWFYKIKFDSSIDLINEIKCNPLNVFNWLKKTHEIQLEKLKTFININNITTLSEQYLINTLKNFQKEQIGFAINNTTNIPPAEPVNIEIPSEAETLRSLYNDYKIEKNNNNYAFLFGLNKGYTENEVINAFKKRFALKLHPDKNTDFPKEAEVLFKLFEGIRTYLINEINRGYGHLKGD